MKNKKFVAPATETVKAVEAEQTVEPITEFIAEPKETPVVALSPIAPPKTAQKGTKYTEVSDLQLAVDPIMMQVLRDYDADNAELNRQFQENNRAKNRMIDRLLSMNGAKVREGAKISFDDAANLMYVPQPWTESAVVPIFAKSEV